MAKLLNFSLLFLLSGCFYPTDDGGDPPPPDFYTEYSPIMMERSQMEQSIEQQSAREISDPAKIYAYNQYLFITEKFKGVHVINNENPDRPVNIGFIRIPGCVDVAVKGTTLFADNATDLIGLDVTDPNSVREISRVRHAFPVLLPPDLGELPEVYRNRDENLIIVEWRK
jgi:hypothetical protein